MDIVTKIKDVSFKNGKFLSDKSSGYDSVYFLVKFIRDYSVAGYFDLARYRGLINKYISFIFNKDENNSDIQNYHNDILHILEYSKTIKKVGKSCYQIIDIEMIDFICFRMENAYIYLYLLTYFTLQNSHLLGLYKEYCFEKDKSKKKDLLLLINDKLTLINPSVNCTSDKQWAKQNTQYIMNVMNFINEEPKVTRDLNIVYNEGIRNIESISMNINGTKTTRKKNNGYLNHFNMGYINDNLKNYIIKKEN